MRRRFLSGVAVALLLVALCGSQARADSTYHSQHIAFAPVGDAPLRTGFIENIHANGPNVFASEIYALNGAGVSTSYQVALSIWVTNTSCSGPSTLELASAVLTTNAAGNGNARATFTPADAAELRGLTISVIWTISLGSSVVYATGCEIVQLD